MKPILEIQNISKQYRIQHLAGGYLSLRERLMQGLSLGKNTREDFWALDQISFDVLPGESIGIIGRNGAGKSTLLKILSRITPPTKGRIVSRGRVASLLEVGTGFHPELTGRENIFFNGSLLGMKRKEIESKFDEMVDFSGTEKFLDTPLKHFSSGMQLRLAFAVAAFLEPEILIIDEVLAVGDYEFQKKCIGKMEDVSKNGRTILFVSHNLGAVNQLCSKAVLLQNGKLVFQGKTNDVVKKYLGDTDLSSNFLRREKLNKEIYIQEISSLNSDRQRSTEFKHNEEVLFRFSIARNGAAHGHKLLVIVQDEMKRRIFSSEEVIQSDNLVLRIEPNTLTRGRYSLVCIIYIPAVTQFDVLDDCCGFNVIDGGSEFSHLDSFDYGTVFAKTSWTSI